MFSKTTLIAIFFVISLLLGGRVSYGGEEGCSLEVSVIQKVAESNLERGIAQLTDFSIKQFEAMNIECGVHAIERASTIIQGQLDQTTRAATGYKIKDAVFSAIESRQVADLTTKKRLIAAALQSVDSNKKIINSSGVDERINDAAFLVRLAKYFDSAGLRNESKDTYVLAIRLDQSLPSNSTRLPTYPLLEYIEKRIKVQEFMEAAELLSPISKEERQCYYARLIDTLRYSDVVSLYRTNHLKGLSQEAIKREIMGMKALLPLLEDIKPQERSMAGNSWIVFPCLFIGDGYHIMGESTNAKLWYDKAIRTARNDADPIPRCRLLVTIAVDIYIINYDRILARNLIEEAERIAHNHPDPKWQKELMSNVNAGKNRMH